MEGSSRVDSEREAVRHPLRVGIVGAGSMGRAHARAVERGSIPAVVEAVVDPVEERRSSALEGLHRARGYASVGGMVEGAGVDVVHVCTPAGTHAQVAEEALRAGCHVYVEKPFASTSEEARRLLDLARRRNLLVCAGHQLLENPAVRGLSELAAAVGPPVHVESYFSFRPVRHGTDGKPPLGEDIQLLDVLPHPVYLLFRALRLLTPGEAFHVESLGIGRGGTVHGLVRAGHVRGTLVVTLTGRPVENYLRIVGERGRVEADLVRGTTQALLGPGTSGISKVIHPYRLSAQLALGTTSALAARLLRRQARYPGLEDLVEAFHRAIREGDPSPLQEEEILETVRLCERVGRSLVEAPRAVLPQPAPRPGADGGDGVGSGSSERVVVTGGTGFLGRRVVEELARRGYKPVVLARREPPPWRRPTNAEFHACDLSAHGPPPEALDRAAAVVHCAAATAGGFEAHRRHSVDATRNLVNAMAEAGVRRLLHVSSLAVLAPEAGSGALGDHSRLREDPEKAGPYVWGKAESEHLARSVAREHGIDLRIVRPGPIVDTEDFDPPGRLGRRLTDRLFLMVGGRAEPLPAISVDDLARALVTGVERFQRVPEAVNLVDDPPRSRGEMVDLMRRANPHLRVVRLPRWIFTPLALCAGTALRVARPRGTVPDIRAAFASPRVEFERPDVFRFGTPGKGPEDYIVAGAGQRQVEQAGPEPARGPTGATEGKVS